MPIIYYLLTIAVLFLSACNKADVPPIVTETVSTSVAVVVATSEPTDTPTPTNTPSPSPSPQPTATNTDTPTPAPTDTPTPTPSPTFEPNPMGMVLVLEYHLIGEPEGRWQRTPDNFRADLQRLYEEGYSPANIIDLTLGFPELPAGRKPVVFSFDDSDISQFRYLDDGSIDPDTAVGMLYSFHLKHPDEWPLKSTFYVLQDVDVPERILFGQKEYQDKKLKWLVEQGFEIGSHTISHFNLSAGSDEQIQWQLAVSQRQLEKRLPGYDVRSLSVPFGSYPKNIALLKQGQWENKPYSYANTVMVAGGASPSPHSSDFDPYYIPRVQAIQLELNYWLDYFAQKPELYYISGGQ